MNNSVPCYLIYVATASLALLQATNADDPPAVASPTFAEIDADADGFASLAEAFPSPTKPADRRRYFLWDVDGDGRLNAAEWSERHEHRTALNLHRGEDADGDGVVSSEELLADAGPERLPGLRQQLAIFDVDGQPGLSVEEFARSPALVPAEARGTLLDPIAAIAEERIERLQPLVETPASIEVWTQRAREVLPQPIPLEARWWDTNGDSTVDAKEVRAGVLLAYGVQRAGGGLSRFGDGLVFNEHLYRQLDPDGDRALAGAELAKVSQRLNRTAEQVAALDINSDGRLEMSELDAVGLFRTDTSREFLRWDRDRDGSVARLELLEQARTYDAQIAAEMIPAFDLDGDQQIDLTEFLQSPLADGSFLANDLRRDADHDLAASPMEFFPRGGLALSGLAALYLSRLDTNQDGLLNLGEAAFVVEWKQVDRQSALRVIDQNADASIDLAEYLRMLPGEPARRQFFLLDGDGDSKLSADEWNAHVEHRTAANLFRAYDGDGDGRVSEAELRGAPGTGEPDGTTQRLAVFDIDRDKQLSLDEFGTIPDLVAAEHRLPISDPVADVCSAKLAEIRQDVVLPLPVTEWAARGRAFLPEPIPLEAADWDADGNGGLSDEELATGVELAYGVRRAGGGLARFGDGRVFNEHSFRQCDADGDRVLSTAEFARFSRQVGRTLEQVQAMDPDADGRITSTELDAVKLFRNDMHGQFLWWDTNKDGVVQSEELLSQARSWEREIAPYILPAFDLDQDERISLKEFLGSPLADGAHFANEIRSDSNHDGRLSVAEFFPGGGLPFAGLAALYFERLDRDDSGWLERTEIRFGVDLHQLPSTVAFQWLDADQNQSISLLEAFGVESPDDLLLPRGGRLFAALDADQDGTLTLAEVPSLGDLNLASEAERVLRHDVRPALAKLDRDSDGVISPAEWPVDAAAKDSSTVPKRFLRADGDGDGQVDLWEYADDLGTNQPTWPRFQDALRTRVESLVNDLSAQSADDRSVAASARAAEEMGLRLPAEDIRDWDVDHNDDLTWMEIERGLEVAFGIRSPAGRPLRQGRDRTFNARRFAGIDRNRDGFLTATEFTSPERPKDQLAAEFAAADVNQDGRVAFEESLDVPWLWSSVDYLLGRLDTDKDRRVSPVELAHKAQSWEQQVARWTFPTFDSDGDGTLSHVEFQRSPIAAPFAQWDGTLIDGNDDDRIAFDEFHPAGQAWLRGLSSDFFAKLDRDNSGALTAEEVAFTIDFKTAPLATVFQKFDRDGDNRLTVNETLEGRGKSTNRGWMMQTEDAFYAADADRDGALSVEEFTAPQTTVALLASGRATPAKPRGGRRPATAQVPAATESDWDPKMIVIVGLNILLIIGIAWYLLRSPAR